MAEIDILANSKQVENVAQPVIVVKPWEGRVHANILKRWNVTFNTFRIVGLLLPYDKRLNTVEHKTCFVFKISTYCKTCDVVVSNMTVHVWTNGNSFYK